MLAGFRVPTATSIAPGCSLQTADVLRARGLERVLVVTDAGVRATGAFARFLDGLESSALHVAVDDDVMSNPRVATAQRLGERAREERFDGIVGIGGGSVLDAAKAGAMLATNPGPASGFVGRNLFAEAPLPFIALPTTCGTGSEVTWVSVLSDPEREVKVSIKGDGMFPDAALVDPDLLAELPAHLIASTGLDALTHAIEAVTVSCRNPVSDALGTAAIGLLLDWLPRAVQEREAGALFQVARASTLAGMAFGNSDVGGVHCLSESIGGLHDLPHGLLNAALLIPVFESHGESVVESLASVQRVLGPGDGAPAPDLAAQLLGSIRDLARTIGIPSFSELDVPESDYDRLAELAVQNGSNDSNPRPMRAKDYRQILERAGR
ncbi:MAG: iron-containing alcohol dehydrogenase [Planctomycetota bacterium]